MAVTTALQLEEHVAAYGAEDPRSHALDNREVQASKVQIPSCWTGRTAAHVRMPVDHLAVTIALHLDAAHGAQGLRRHASKIQILADGQGGPQPSRAQKRRDAKAAQEAEREARIAEEQAAMGDSARVIEERSLAELLSPLGLAVRSIPVSCDSWWASFCDGARFSERWRSPHQHVGRRVRCTAAYWLHVVRQMLSPVELSLQGNSVQVLQALPCFWGPRFKDLVKPVPCTNHFGAEMCSLGNQIRRRRCQQEHECQKTG